MRVRCSAANVLLGASVSYEQRSGGVELQVEPIATDEPVNCLFCYKVYIDEARRRNLFSAFPRNPDIESIQILKYEYIFFLQAPLPLSLIFFFYA